MFRLQTLTTLAALFMSLTACERTDTAMARQQQAWIGQPVRSFAEQHSLVPAGVDNISQTERTYIFRKPQGYTTCGVTIGAAYSSARGEFMINEMTSTCPPGSL
jgi:hypothetical protein